MDGIKRVRKALGLSLTDVADGCGLHPEAVARAERAGIDPRASTVARIAQAMSVPVCRLFDEDSEHERHRTKRRSTK